MWAIYNIKEFRTRPDVGYNNFMGNLPKEGALKLSKGI
jgi:hypothetical protein